MSGCLQTYNQWRQLNSALSDDEESTDEIHHPFLLNLFECFRGDCGMEKYQIQ